MRKPAEVSAPETGAQNLVQYLQQQARHPSDTAARAKRGGAWTDISWGQVLEKVKSVSEGLLAIGVKPGDRVAIFANTSYDWLVCDFAISASGAITVPVYGSNTPDELRYILNHAEASVLLVDNDEKDAKQPGRISRVRARVEECPSVRKVVLFEGPPQGGRELSLADLISQGEARAQQHPGAFDERVAQVRADDTCCIIYTSGTTGDPKGVMLSHGAWMFEAVSVNRIGLMMGDDAVMLFLPMAHVFGQVVKAAWVANRFKLIFAESVDKLLANVAETHPTVLPSVPRVFEKVYNKVIADGSAAPGVKGTLFRWAIGLFDRYVEARLAGREYSSLQFELAKRLVFSKISATLREKLGGQLRLFISGGAPLSRKIAYFFDLLGFKVIEGYGLTETAAASTVVPISRIKIGTVGPALPGSEAKIAEDGEILLRGPQVMKGYFKNDAATREMIDAEGWLHSGDIGEKDADGYVTITDRKKDIIVTAGGKNVAPQNLENLLKTFPLVSTAMIHGDKRAYLTALICVSEEGARKLLSEKGVTVGGYAELAQRPEIRHAVQAVIDQVNSEQPPYNSIKKFALMDHDFTQDSGELTPTLKVKRKFCSQKYKATLDGFYGEAVHD